MARSPSDLFPNNSNPSPLRNIGSNFENRLNQQNRQFTQDIRNIDGHIDELRATIRSNTTPGTQAELMQQREQEDQKNAMFVLQANRITILLFFLLYLLYYVQYLRKKINKEPILIWGIWLFIAILTVSEIGFYVLSTSSGWKFNTMKAIGWMGIPFALNKLHMYPKKPKKDQTVAFVAAIYAIFVIILQIVYISKK